MDRLYQSGSGTEAEIIYDKELLTSKEQKIHKENNFKVSER